MGADSNASTSDDWTIYYMTIPASALSTAVEIESDRFQNLKYDKASFQKEARAVLGEYNKSASSPFLKLYESLQNTAYTNHTYKHTTIGFLSDIKDMPNQYTYSKIFFDRWYRPDNCTVIVAGDVKHGELVQLAKRFYGGWKRGTAKVDIPTEPAQREHRSAHLSWPVPTLNTVLLGYHIPATDPKNPDTAALDALAQAIFGETSPLYQELVLKEQKAVMLAAESEPKRDPGLFTILARSRNAADLSAVRKRISEALQNAAKSPINESRLNEIKSHLRYDFATTLTTPNNVARIIALTISVAGRPEAINELYEAYERLTPADLQRAAAKYFVPNNETEITLEPEAGK
jgi:zinc protease